MTSDAQIDANRRNARASTGPKSPEGKAAASQNALRHGLTSSQLILFEERQEDFDRFAAELRTAHAPADAVEDGLVERIVMAQWRLRRVWRAETAALNAEALRIARHRARAAAKTAIAEELKAHPPDGAAMTPEEINRLAARTAQDLSDDALEEAMTPDDDDETAPERGRPDTLVWPERMTHLSRYESQLERTLQRATRDLARRQGERRLLALTTAQAAADQAALERRTAEIRARMARERAAATPGAAPPPPPPPDMSAVTLAELEAQIEIAKRSQFPAPQRGNGAMNAPLNTR